jgi:energy-coupling factor transporter ATP-binding protein EcfA2
MSKYTFKLSNYHAIEKAEIILDGITVLSGENGSGKSTISRWLYYLIKGTNEYEIFVEKEAMSEIRSMLDSIRRASMILDFDNIIRSTQTRQVLSEIWKVGIESFQDKFNSIVDSFVDSLFEELSSRRSVNTALRRLSTVFQLELTKDDNIDSVLNKISDQLRRDYQKTLLYTIEQKKKRDTPSLTKFIRNIASPGDGWPNELSLDEDQLPLINKREFREPVMLNRAIYYGTQRTINSLDYDSELDKMLRRPLSGMPNMLGAIRMRIQSVINGTITYEDETSLLMDEPGLYYHRKTDNLRIPLKQAATGITSFAYLLQLLNNGYLQKDTLLIIDEPEAHLHPQWIVEFARLLVLLNKKIGMKVLVSSHNPDMVSAIQSISRKEGIIDTVHFYVAQKRNEENTRYIYKDLGAEIGEIFESFNIALSRIQMYGEQN